MSKTLVIFIVIGLLIKIVMIAFLSLGQSLDQSMLQPGDEIDMMTLTTGAADAPPLWAFCRYQEGNQRIEAHCQTPPMSKLAIGNAFLVPDYILNEAELSDLTWGLSIDGRARPPLDRFI